MIHPYKRKILVKPDPEKQEEATDSGILVQKVQKKRDGSDVKLFRGEIIAVGDEVTLNDVKIKAGMFAYYNSFNAYSLTDELSVVDESGLYAVETK